MTTRVTGTTSGRLPIQAQLAVAAMAAIFLQMVEADRANAQQISAAMRQACSADVKSLCGDVQPGGGRIIACLKQNASSISDGCKQAMASAKSAQ